ncbi:MAG: DUF6160 family protein [Dissulfuribacterales bacterium]
MRIKKTRTAIPFITLCAICLFLFPSILMAELAPLEDGGLEQICGAGGISIAVKNVQVFNYIDTYRYCASDNGYLEFNNIKIHDGAGGPYLLNYDFGTVTDSGIMYLDVFETSVAPVNDWSGVPIGSGDAITRGMTSLIVPNWDQKIAYTISDFIFCDPTSTVVAGPVDLGQIDIGVVDIPSFSIFTSPRIGGSGFDWESDFQMTVDKFSYAYQIDPANPLNFKSLFFENNYFGASFADLAGDDPRFPSTWKPNNNTDFGQFKIGDLFGDISTDTPSNPASFDVGEGDIYGTGTIYGLTDLRLSMQGSIRFESAQFDTTDFGPGAIDGINVHRLELQLIP